MKKAERTKRPYRARKHAFDAERISAWRRKGLSWTWIGRRFGCDHTTVLYAAARMGCEMGRQAPKRTQP